MLRRGLQRLHVQGQAPGVGASPGRRVAWAEGYFANQAHAAQLRVAETQARQAEEAKAMFQQLQ